MNGKIWTVYAVGGSPAQAVLHEIMGIMKVEPDLVVSGINYGENVASGVTISGTVGAALESASFGIPSLAMSLGKRRHRNISRSRIGRFLCSGSFHQGLRENCSRKRCLLTWIFEGGRARNRHPEYSLRVTRQPHRYFDVVAKRDPKTGEELFQYQANIRKELI